MADNRIDPSEEIPEADLLEQRAPLDPDAATDTPAAVPLDAPADVVDEADRLDQQAVAPDEGEDDYHTRSVEKAVVNGAGEWTLPGPELRRSAATAAPKRGGRACLRGTRPGSGIGDLGVGLRHRLRGRVKA